ncbi:hypothetical protein CROQUDRAFT_102712 [Cronartium quercuum f. sp. fusiforme G11]|uniref:Uncharacterized protein n=1 Tax=Cronartium quercuum f. sp. fusiforme G11 TaxID=708437 RepID=A0A9P6N5G9_9BASI|nr:hypothetical protein CROQUDRAFT_102712 [Cronartium quercuum f. sp. fusiforme G11]
MRDWSIDIPTGVVNRLKAGSVNQHQGRSIAGLKALYRWPIRSSINHRETCLWPGLLLVESPAFDQLSTILVDRREAGLSTGLFLVESPAVDQLSTIN